MVKAGGWGKIGRSETECCGLVVCEWTVSGASVSQSKHYSFSQHVQAYINKRLFVLPSGTNRSAVYISCSSSPASLTAVQQLEQVNTAQDPPDPPRYPSYVAVQLAAFHSWNINKKQRVFTQMKVGLMREITLMDHIGLGLLAHQVVIKGFTEC